MLGTFPKDSSQVATSQGYFPKWELPECAISQAGTFQVCPSRSVLEDATWEIITWEVALGSLWEST